MSTRRQIVGIFTVLVMVLLVACAPQAAPAPAPQAPAPAAARAPAPAPAAVPAAPAKPAWQAEWEKTEAAAKQEGSVVLYTTLGATHRQMIASPFLSKYGVRLESVSALSSENAEKILSQRRAGLYQVDLWISGVSTIHQLKPKNALDPLEPALILPELTDPELIKKTWYFGQISWVDKDHLMLFSLMDLKEPFTINTNLVKRDEIKTYRDLLDPKWKGKISLLDPTTDGMGQLWFAFALESKSVDENYMRELAKQELTITRDRRGQVEWLARGKHAIAMGPYTAAVTEFIQIGAPIERFRMEPANVSGTTSGTSLLNRAPHPNAAKLFINWLLTQEGQTTLSQALLTQSQRLDVSTSHLEPSRMLTPGLKVLVTANEEFIGKQTGAYAQLAKEIFGPSIGK